MTEKPPPTEEIQREIERTRDELGDTADALAAKADVKARARERVDAAKARVRETRARVLGGSDEGSPGSHDAVDRLLATARANPLPAGAVGGFAAGLVAGLLIRGRR